MNRYFLSVPLALILFLAPLFPAAAQVPVRDLYLGARGTDVAALQELLISRSTGPAAAALRSAGATGYFGSLTRAAVKELQAAKGVTPQSGYFGPLTRAAIASDTVSFHAPTFTGAIEAVDTGCFADGVCSVTVDGKEVVLLAGLRIDPPPVGSLKGVDSIGDLESMIGATARVYAATTTEGSADYTLYGSTDYYVEVEPKFVGEPITVTGTVGCLPPKDPTKPTIMMCAFGLKAEDGTHYALRDEEGKLASLSGDTVEVTGLFAKEEHATWASVGTIKVESAKAAD